MILQHIHMKDLCLIIPTQDRPKQIEYYLQNQACLFSKYAIDVIIYDSSMDDSTKNVVESMSMVDNVFYFRYTGKINISSIDNKVFEACKQFADPLRYRYICLSSDSTILHFDKIFSKLAGQMTQNVDLFILDDESHLSFEERNYSDPKTLFHDLCWRMTMLCSNIISCSFLKEVVDKHPYEEESCKGFWLPMAYFKLFCEGRCHAQFFRIAKYFSIYPFRVQSFWFLSGNVLWQWGIIWTESIDELPSFYDSEKSSVKLSHDKYMHIFSLYNLLIQKKYGNLTLSKIKNAKKFIPQVTKTPLIDFYLISILINRFSIALIPDFDSKLIHILLTIQSKKETI